MRKPISMIVVGMLGGCSQGSGDGKDGGSGQPTPTLVTPSVKDTSELAALQAQLATVSGMTGAELG